MENPENTQPQPGADPREDIETVIPSAEQEVVPVEDTNQQSETEHNDESGEKGADVEVDESQEGSSDVNGTDEHGIETVSP